MKHALRHVLSALVLLNATANVAASASGEPASLLPVEKVTPKLWRGPAPTAEGVRQLADLGIRTIVDLRLRESRLEKSRAEALGINYVHLPLGYWAPTKATIAKFLSIVQDPSEGSVFAHCRQGADRTGTLVGLYRRVVQHWSYEDAYLEMRAHHFKPWLLALRERVEDYPAQEAPQLKTLCEAIAANAKQVPPTYPRHL